MKDSVLIIGGGLCGALLAIRLAQRGFPVHVVESRADLRVSEISAGRSINLAFSNRGMKAMNLVGINEKVMELCLPMEGRMIHTIKGEIFMTPYSGNPENYINSISRGGLNGLLLSEAEAHEVKLTFNTRCIGVDLDKRIARFRNLDGGEMTLTADIIFGTDGAGSALRNSYYQSNQFLFNFSREFLQHGYKELSIPPSEKGEFQLESRALHIWPRKSFMLIALPNLDKSFTVTLFLAFKGEENSFESIADKTSLLKFFRREFPDALNLMPSLEQEFLENPTGALGTVKCSPWNHGRKTMLMGDAAHAIVPFYGQGMNASFEDVVVLDQMLDKNRENWQNTFEEFSQQRKVDTDAIADLAIDNFYEMRDHVSNESFRIKRKLEMKLERNFPDQYFSKYSMVTFNTEIPYSVAMSEGRKQDAELLQLIESGVLTEDSKADEVLTILKKDKH